MKKAVSLAVLFAAAAAAALGACAQGTTDFETEGDGGDGGTGPGSPPTSTGSSGACTGCDPNATCDQSSGQPVCVCNAGYSGDGKLCADVDECAADPMLCGMGGMCANEPGGYSCSCAPGFEDAGGTCVDADECAVNEGGCADGCSCMNEMGAPPTCDCVLTQSNSQTVIAANSVSCNNGTEHTDNSYYRVFDLGALGVDGDFTVTEVEVGIESATSALASQPAQVKLHALNGALTVANLTSISTTNVNVNNNTIETVLPFTVSGTAAASSKLVVEFFTPTGIGNLLYVGSNNLGETGPTYIRAVDCALNEPETAASIGFADMHMVMNVHGTYQKAP